MSDDDQLDDDDPRSRTGCLERCCDALQQLMSPRSRTGCLEKQNDSNG